MKPHYRILRLNHGRAPTVQYATLKEAETEALRLAGQHPGETFEILKVLGLARTTEPAVFWNDGVEPPAPGKGQEGWDPRPAPTPETRYPTTPLPEGFDRWVCRGTGWQIPDGAVWCSRWTEAAGKSAAGWEQEALVGPKGRGWYDGGRSDLEYWEAVKDEPAYRMLEPGEVIEEGDEFQSLGWDDVPRGLRDWEPVTDFAIGERLLSSNAGHYRRPLNKKQAP